MIHQNNTVLTFSDSSFQRLIYDQNKISVQAGTEPSVHNLCSYFFLKVYRYGPTLGSNGANSLSKTRGPDEGKST